ncbi:CotO family spore coat protein [Virgibacillus ihumii]|uniref:CotO family spore coat protein n=1 Tax=Virgibacillus ihumii TaxID=2686091 RepID=UPI00157C6C73|nr:CotO family spore coat protein [Virgibacillus ihumii]
MGQKKYAKSPLLYIHQPTIRTPEAPMQHNYRTPKKGEDSTAASSNDGIGAADAVPRKKAPARRLQKRDNFSKPAEEKINEDSTVATDDSNEKMDPTEDKGGDDRKKFKDMTVRERLDYFLNTPKHVPTMRCEIKTEERKYRGRIVDFQEERVYMQVGRRKSATKIPFDEILEIGLIGF